MSVNDIILIAFAACILLTQEGHAGPLTKVSDDQVRPTFQRVTDLLRPLGAKDGPLPPVYMATPWGVPELRGHASITFKGAIYVDSGRPFDCLEADVAHQISHFLLGRDAGMGWKASEPLARAVETEIAGNLVNCVSQRGE